MFCVIVFFTIQISVLFIVLAVFSDFLFTPVKSACKQVEEGRNPVSD